MLYKVEHILIPETYVRISVKTEVFDDLIKNEFSEDIMIYNYKGSRYLFMDDDFVIEELKNGCS